MSGQLLGYLWDAPPLRRPFSCLKKQVLTDIPVFFLLQKTQLGLDRIWSNLKQKPARHG